MKPWNVNLGGRRWMENQMKPSEDLKMGPWMKVSWMGSEISMKPWMRPRNERTLGKETLDET
jgi:hypothetical protein